MNIKKLQKYAEILGISSINDPIKHDYPALFKQIIGTFEPFLNYANVPKLSMKQVVNTTYNLLFLYYDYIPRLVPEAFFEVIKSNKVTEQKIKITLLLTKLFVWFNIKHSKLPKQLKNKFQLFLPQKYVVPDMCYVIVYQNLSQKDDDYFQQFRQFQKQFDNQIIFDYDQKKELSNDDSLNQSALNTNQKRSRSRHVEHDDQQDEKKHRSRSENKHRKHKHHKEDKEEESTASETVHIKKRKRHEKKDDESESEDNNSKSRKHRKHKTTKEDARDQNESSDESIKKQHKKRKHKEKTNFIEQIDEEQFLNNKELTKSMRGSRLHMKPEIELPKYQISEAGNNEQQDINQQTGLKVHDITVYKSRVPAQFDQQVIQNKQVQIKQQPKRQQNDFLNQDTERVVQHSKNLQQQLYDSKLVHQLQQEVRRKQNLTQSVVISNEMTQQYLDQMERQIAANQQMLNQQENQIRQSQNQNIISNQQQNSYYNQQQYHSPLEDNKKELDQFDLVLQYNENVIGKHSQTMSQLDDSQKPKIVSFSKNTGLSNIQQGKSILNNSKQQETLPIFFNQDILQRAINIVKEEQEQKLNQTLQQIKLDNEYKLQTTLKNEQELKQQLEKERINFTKYKNDQQMQYKILKDCEEMERQKLIAQKQQELLDKQKEFQQSKEQQDQQKDQLYKQYFDQLLEKQKQESAFQQQLLQQQYEHKLNAQQQEFQARLQKLSQSQLKEQLVIEKTKQSELQGQIEAQTNQIKQLQEQQQIQKEKAILNKTIQDEQIKAQLEFEKNEKDKQLCLLQQQLAVQQGQQQALQNEMETKLRNEQILREQQKQQLQQQLFEQQRIQKEIAERQQQEQIQKYQHEQYQQQLQQQLNNEQQKLQNLESTLRNEQLSQRQLYESQLQQFREKEKWQQEQEQMQELLRTKLEKDQLLHQVEQLTKSQKQNELIEQQLKEQEYANYLKQIEEQQKMKRNENLNMKQLESQDKKKTILKNDSNKQDQIPIQTNVNDVFQYVNTEYGRITSERPPIAAVHSRGGVKQGEMLFNQICLKKSSSFDQSNQLSFQQVDYSSEKQGIDSSTSPILKSPGQNLERNFAQNFLKTFVKSTLDRNSKIPVDSITSQQKYNGKTYNCVDISKLE